MLIQYNNKSARKKLLSFYVYLVSENSQLAKIIDKEREMYFKQLNEKRLKAYQVSIEKLLSKYNT